MVERDIRINNFEKKIGIYTVYAAHAQQGFTDKNTGYELKPEELFLEIELKDKFDGHFLEESTKSFHLLADQIRQSPIKPKVIMGLTYEKMANTAPRSGFAIADTHIPEEAKQEVEKNYNNLSPLYKKGLPAGKISLVYQTTEDFLKRF